MAVARFPLPSMHAWATLFNTWLSVESQRELTRLERLAAFHVLSPFTMTLLSRGQLLSTKVRISVTDSGISTISRLKLPSKAPWRRLRKKREEKKRGGVQQRERFQDGEKKKKKRGKGGCSLRRWIAACGVRRWCRRRPASACGSMRRLRI